MTKPQNKPNKTNVTKTVIIAMLAAVATVLQYLEFPIPVIMPSFLQMDLSDLPELIGAFAVGPVGGVLICLIKNVIHLAVSKSGYVGELANFLLGAVLSLAAGLIYRAKKTKKGALLACVAGTALMAAMSVPINYFIVYPVYIKIMGLENVLRFYTDILPGSDTLLKSLVIFNVPFTLIKGVLVSILAMLIYKPLSRMFVKMNNSFAGKRKNEDG